MTVNYRSNLSDYLRVQGGIVECLAPRAYLRPTQKSVHALRIATRRVRATLWLLEHSSVHLRRESLDRDLRRLGGALGRVRDLDVALCGARRYGLESRLLAARRKTATRRLKALLDGIHRRRLLTQLSHLKATVRSERSISLENARGRLHARMKRQLRRPIHGQVDLHRLRIVMKKTQYALEAMGVSATPITRLQRALGDAHDLEFLQAATGKSKALKKRQRALNKKSVRLVRPTLRFASDQLRRH